MLVGINCFKDVEICAMITRQNKRGICEITGELDVLVCDSDSDEINIKDFTRVFADEQVCRGFLNKGGVLSVAGKSRLLAVCVNPTSPQGYRLDSDLLCSRMREELEVPVYDVVKGKDTIL